MNATPNELVLPCPECAKELRFEPELELSAACYHCGAAVELPRWLTHPEALVAVPGQDPWELGSAGRAVTLVLMIPCAAAFALALIFGTIYMARQLPWLSETAALIGLGVGSVLLSIPAAAWWQRHGLRLQGPVEVFAERVVLHKAPPFGVREMRFRDLNGYSIQSSTQVQLHHQGAAPAWLTVPTPDDAAQAQVTAVLDEAGVERLG